MANTKLTNQRQVFVEEYVRSGDHLEAAKKAGYKNTHTLRNQACKLRRECADEITDELHRNFAEIAPRAFDLLSNVNNETHRNAYSDQVYLKWVNYLKKEGSKDKNKMKEIASKIQNEDTRKAMLERIK